MASFAHKVTPGESVDLSKISTRAPKSLTKEKGKALATELGTQLDELEDQLYFAGQHSVLVVLQGMDTSGKDGALRFLLQHMNAQGVRIAPFKVPTTEELSHDFLWRIHKQTPGKGEFVVFNRSHYEDVLVVRVHNLVPEDVWSKRYDHINQFEQLLSDSKTIILKFFLHISKEEQEERLLAREAETEKAWKLSVGDWKERAHWDAYTHAYEEALGKCSTEAAPWHIIPSDQKWFRDVAIAQTVVDALKPHQAGWLEHLEQLGNTERKALEEFRAAQLPAGPKAKTGNRTRSK